MNYLFAEWGKIKERLNNRYIFLFLDYDGTLTPIVDTPDEAIVPKETRKLVKHLSKSLRCKITIISGRALKDIKERIGLKNIIYVGNHGLEIEGPKIKFASPILPRCRRIFKQIRDELDKKLSAIKGIILEDKGFSLSLHYRLVDKKEISRVKNILYETAFPYLVRNKIKIEPGKMVLEIKPPIEWDKGKVVLWLLAREKFASKGSSVVPIYLGDDKTDEAAFKALRDKGLSIFVGDSKLSQARYYLKNSKEVFEFLKRIFKTLQPTRLNYGRADKSQRSI